MERVLDLITVNEHCIIPYGIIFVNFMMIQVRCGDVDMAIGGDQGGSIRIPAAYQGIGKFKNNWW